MDEQSNQVKTKGDKNKIILAAAGVVVVAAGFYWLMKDNSELVRGDDGVMYEAIPAAVLNVSANALWVYFPLEGDEKKEFSVTGATSIVRLDFTSAGPQETKIGLADLKQNDNLLIYYKAKGNDLELNRVEFLNFPPPPVITKASGYRVLSVEGEGAYRVKNLATGEETRLMVPSDARIAGGQIRTGSILKVNESSVLGNGILAFDLNVE